MEIEMKALAMAILFAAFSSTGLSDGVQYQEKLVAHGDPLSPARGLRSGDGRFWVNMQGDENFVVYGKGSSVCWASNTMREPENNPNADPRVILTKNELAVWVRDPRTQRFTKRKVLANRGSGPAFGYLIMQNDGNLVLYDVTHSSDNPSARFATGMARHKGCDY